MASRILQGKILGALIVSAFILVGAYAYTHRAPALATPAQAADTDALLKSVAAKDTDGDGLPDWEEELYGTSITNAHSVDPNVTDSQAVTEGLVAPRFSSSSATGTSSSTEDIASEIPGGDPTPGGLTDSFAHAFFEQYMDANGGQPPDESTQQQLITGLLDAFKQNTLNIVETHYATSSVRVDDSVSVMEYITNVESILKENDLPPSEASPVTLLDAAINNNDASALQKLNVLANAYASIARGLSGLSVPSSVADTHLSLMRTFDLLAQSTALAANLEHDPLASLAGLSTYETSPKEFVDDMLTLENAVISNVGTPTKGEPGYIIWVIGEHARGL